MMINGNTRAYIRFIIINFFASELKTFASLCFSFYVTCCLKFTIPSKKILPGIVSFLKNVVGMIIGIIFIR